MSKDYARHDREHTLGGDKLPELRLWMAHPDESLCTGVTTYS